MPNEDSLNDVSEEKDKKKVDAIPVNWDDIGSLEEPEEQYEVDENADAFSKDAPPPPSTYEFLVTVDPERGVTQKTMESRRTKENVEYYSISLQFRAMSTDPLIDGATMYVYASTLYSEKKKTSTLITILKNLGVNVKDLTSGVAQLKRLKDFVNSEPIKPIKVDWELSYKDSDNSYKTIYTNFKDFPSDKSTKSGKKEVFEITLKDRSKVECRPRFKVMSWNPANDKSASSSTGGALSGVSKANANTKPVVSKEIADLEKTL